MTEDRKDNKSENQGEGNRTAAKEYNKEQKDFVQSGQVDEAARRAEQAKQGEEREELEKAEEAGKSKAKEFDPAVTRGRGSRS